MKAALCFSGHYRQFPECYASIEQNIIAQNPGWEFKVFIHTYDQLCSDTTNPSWNTPITEASFRFIPQEKEIVIENAERARADLIDLSDVLHWHVHINRTKDPHRYALPMQMRKIYLCNKMVPDGYDSVFRLRPDFKLLTPLPIKDEYRDKINLTNQQMVKDTSRHDLSGYNDIFAFGESALMAYYASLYLHLREYFIYNEIWSPEGALYRHLVPVQDKVNIIEADWLFGWDLRAPFWHGWRTFCQTWKK